MSCSEKPPPDVVYSGISIYCFDKCPDEESFNQELQKLDDIYSPEYKTWELWRKYDFVFQEQTNCREGYYFFAYKEVNPERECPPPSIPVYGATYHNKRDVWLWYYRWEDAINWEAQLVIAEHYIPGSNEGQKIEWIEKVRQ